MLFYFADNQDNAGDKYDKYDHGGKQDDYDHGKYEKSGYDHCKYDKSGGGYEYGSGGKFGSGEGRDHRNRPIDDALMGPPCNSCGYAKNKIYYQWCWACKGRTASYHNQPRGQSPHRARSASPRKRQDDRSPRSPRKSASWQGFPSQQDIPPMPDLIDPLSRDKPSPSQQPSPQCVTFDPKIPSDQKYISDEDFKASPTPQWINNVWYLPKSEDTQKIISCVRQGHYVPFLEKIWARYDKGEIGIPDHLLRVAIRIPKPPPPSQSPCLLCPRVALQKSTLCCAPSTV